MEEYLQYVKALRSQMNDVEDQAAKASMEEHALVFTIGVVISTLVFPLLRITLAYL
ncbi:unnamed protein product [Linum tenue]|uniref:Uncharacterized protein n=1 Tax=Linum tenue TaxID=586396 RepID=A0AAV0REJ7_9ROSI|nr:unnamed protein product [Linum tenue]